MRKGIVIATAVVAFVLGAALLVWPNQVWTMLAGPADLGQIDFATMEKSTRPNAFLVCPATVCTSSSSDMEPPEFELAASALMARAKETWAREPRLQLVDESNTDLTIRYVQRSPLLKFPDTISVKFLALSGQRSTLAIYSRSQIGYSDLGVNEARIQRWLELLKQI